MVVVEKIIYLMWGEVVESEYIYICFIEGEFFLFE